MSVLSIIKPIAATIGSVGNITDGARVILPDPKEAAKVTANGAANIVLDLGVAQSVDSMFLGYTGGYDGSGPLMNFAYSTDAVNYTNVAINQPPATKFMDNTNRHYFATFAAVTARYWSFYLTACPAGWPIGIAAVGKAFRPTYGHEWGSGRSIIDTGSVTRLKSGGFGIDEGVTFGGWQFTLGDLTDDEVDFLYELLKLVGIRGTMLVVEDPDLPGIGHNKLHWSIFQRIDYFERIKKNLSRWSLKLEEWA